MGTVRWRDQVKEFKQQARGRLGFGDRPVLQVIDMQREYANPECPWYVEMAEEVTRNLSILLKAARRKGMPVLYTYNGFREDLVDAGLLPLKLPDLKGGVCREGTEGSMIIEDIAPQGGDHVINKRRYSAFYGTEMGLVMQGVRADTVIVTGCVTSGCVRETAYDAYQRGFRPIVPEECVGDRLPSLHEQSLFILDTWMADVLPLAEVLEYVEGLPDPRR